MYIWVKLLVFNVFVIFSFKILGKIVFKICIFNYKIELILYILYEWVDLI